MGLERGAGDIEVLHLLSDLLVWWPRHYRGSPLSFYLPEFLQAPLGIELRPQ